MNLHCMTKTKGIKLTILPLLLLILLLILLLKVFKTIPDISEDLSPDRISMAEDAQSRVQAAVKSFVNDVDRTHLRTLVKHLFQNNCLNQD